MGGRRGRRFCDGKKKKNNKRKCKSLKDGQREGGSTEKRKTRNTQRGKKILPHNGKKKPRESTELENEG